MNNQNLINSEKDGIDVLKEISYYIFFWPWFIFSVFIILISAYTYLRYSTSVYSTSATLQVRDSQSDPASFLSQSSTSMFNFNRVKIDNYTAQIKSKPNLSKVIKSLDLQTKVYLVGTIKNTLQYKNDIPFEINFKNNELYDEEGIRINFNLGDSPYIFFNEQKYTLENKSSFNHKDFSLNLRYIPDESAEYLVVRNSEKSLITELTKAIEITSSSDEGDNIDIKMDGVNINRNESIIQSLINVAHEDQKRDKQQIYSLSIDFINSRLITIINEIDSLSLETIGFKSKNLIFSPELQTNNALSNLSDLELEKFNLNTQLELARSLQRNLNDQSDYSLLPSNIGIDSGNVNDLVLSYNTLVLERNDLLSGATMKNPLILQISEQLRELKQNIIISINNYIQNINTSLEKFKEFENSTSEQVAQIPELEAALNTFQRKFQLAENLYLFLLQRREEASISLKSTLADTRVINFPYTNPIPISPRKKIVYLGSLILGLLIPAAVLYLLKIFDNKIYTREDFNESLPNYDILGEIPFVEDTVSAMSSRGIFAESSRIIRSNIAYKLLGKNKSNVILVTSSIKGEGKTLTAFNIASSYASTGKKVLLIGADLRNPQIHKLTSRKRSDYDKGLSSFLIDSNINYKEIIFKVDIFNDKTFDILNSGAIPPNPAELLGSKNFENLLEDLKKEYEYIFIDSAPLLLVSDTLPILRLADLVLYNLRSGYTDKNITTFINETVRSKNLSNVGFILNAIKAGPNSYLKYGYSYRYGYSYKYNYGYGYGYSKDN